MLPLPFPPFCFSPCPTCTQIDIHTLLHTLTAPLTLPGTSKSYIGRWRCTVGSEKCVAEGPLQSYLFILSLGFLSYSPSLACRCLFVCSCLLSLQIFPSPLCLLSDRQLRFILFPLWKQLSFFVLLRPNHAFPRPPLTSSSSQPRRARVTTAVKLHSLEIHLDGGQESAQDRPRCQSHGLVISCARARHRHAPALFSYVDRGRPILAARNGNVCLLTEILQQFVNASHIIYVCISPS